MKPVRVAIVGCGVISQLHHMGYVDFPEAELVALCDTNKSLVKKHAAEWNVAKTYTDYDELLKDKDIDMVELLTPHHLHCEMTEKACAAGKHVSVQKPMALSAAEADRMIAAAKKAGVVFRVYENFVYYAPAVKAKELIDAGEIGEVRTVRMHVSTGNAKNDFKIPLSAWAWRFNEKTCGGGPLVFDHGYHLFSVGHFLGGPVEKVSGWIDKTPVKEAGNLVHIDAPAMIMFKYKAARRYGQLDIEYTPKMHMDSLYYADDDRIEIVGEKGILFINRYTARTIDLPELMMFKDAKTTPIPVQGVEWHDSFIAATRDMIHAIHESRQPKLDGETAKSVLQFTLAALQSSAEGHEVRPDEVK